VQREGIPTVIRNGAFTYWLAQKAPSPLSLEVAKYFPRSSVDTIKCGGIFTSEFVMSLLLGLTVK